MFLCLDHSAIKLYIWEVKFFFFNFDCFLVFLESLLTNEYFTPNSNYWAENPLSLGIPGEDPGRIGLS